MRSKLHSPDIELFSAVHGSKKKLTDSNWCVLGACEILLSRKLKCLCDDTGKEIDPKQAAEILHGLGQVYRQRGPDKISLIKSAILFNAALVRKPANESAIENDLDELCSHALYLAGVVNTNVSLRGKADLLKKSIDEFRETVKERLGSIEFDCDHGFDSKEFQSKKIAAIENLQQEIYDWYSNLMKDIMDYCVSIKTNLPCGYALAGMGSLARKEITPYSDFEHIILLEEGVQEREDYEKILEYFRWVSVIFHIIVVNIGETIVPCAALTYLNNSGNKNYNWFYDGKTKRGISFDGMFPHASKFPLGKSATTMKPWKTELIKPVSGMLQYIYNGKDQKDVCHLADILTVTCFVSGNQQIVSDFQSGVTQTATSIKSLQIQLEEDIRNFNPINNLSKVSQSTKWNIKRVVCRSTTLFISALGRFYGLRGNGSFDIVRRLTEKQLVEETFAQDLSFAVAIACHVRLFTYLLNDRQEDWLHNSSTADDFSLRFTQIMGRKTPVVYFQTAMKLQRKIFEVIGLFNSNFVQWSSRLDRLLACFWLQLYEPALWEAEKIYNDESKSTEEVKIVNEVLLAIGSTHFESKKFTQALHCFQSARSSIEKFCSQVCDDDLIHCLHFIGGCFYALRKYENSLQHYRKELEMRKKEQGIQTINIEIATCHENLASILQTLERYDEAVVELEKAVLIKKELVKKFIYKIHENQSLTVAIAEGTKGIGDCLYHQQRVDEALKYYEEAIDVRKLVSTRPDADVTLAAYYEDMSVCLYKLEEFADAERFFKLSKTIMENRRETVSQAEVADTARWIADCLHEQRKFDEALRFYEEAVKAKKSVSQHEETDTTLATYYHNMGVCLYDMEELNAAKTLFEKSKIIVENNSGSKPDARIADKACWIGDCLYQQRQFDKALEYYEEAIYVRIMLSQDEETDDILKTYYYNMGACLCRMEKYEDGIALLVKSNTTVDHGEEAFVEAKIATTTT